MVIDSSLTEEPHLEVYFVYDDILVSVWNAAPETIEAILPYITYVKSHFLLAGLRETDQGEKEASSVRERF